jgi:hypothetical protein
MKWMIAAWLVLMVSAVHAVECGPLIMQSKVGAIKDSLTDALDSVRRYQNVLLNEREQLLASKQPADRLIEARNYELDALNNAWSAGEVIRARLDTVSILFSTRDLMVDKRDRIIVEQHLSLAAEHTKRSAETSYIQANTSLTRLSRSGMPIDVARMVLKLRDAIGSVSGEFQRCELPKLPSRQPPTPQ